MEGVKKYTLLYVICTYVPLLLNDLYSSPNIVREIKIEKNEMGRTCSAYGGEKRRMLDFVGET